jgi:small acid-soluble spore protein H (minor)
MDHIMAKQIIESHGVIEVLYQSKPVWIEQVTSDNQAEVTILDTNERIRVPLEELSENSTAF